MSNSKISELPLVTTPLDIDLFAIVQNGITSKISWLNIKNNISGGSAGTLAETLGNGNITGGTNIILSSGDTIKPASGLSMLDLRFFGDDSTWYLGLFDGVSDFTSFVSGSTNEGIIASADATSYFGLNIKGKFSALGAYDPQAADSYTSIVPGQIVAYNDSFLTATTDVVPTAMLVADATVSNRSSSITQPTSILINSGSGASPSQYNQNVSRSVILGGVGLTAKTNNSAYANKMILQVAGSTFDGALVPAAISTDRTWTFPDNSGQVALTTDISPRQTIATAVNYNAVDGDIIFGTVGAGGITVTLPSATADNMQVTVKQIDNGGGNLGINSAGGLIENTIFPFVVPAQFNGFQFTSHGGNWWVTGIF